MGGDDAGGAAAEGGDAEADPMYDQAVAVVLKTRRPSISLVQRHLRIGYNRAARLIEQMENAGTGVADADQRQPRGAGPGGQRRRVISGWRRRVALVLSVLSFAGEAAAGPVDLYLTVPASVRMRFRRRAPRISEAQAIARTRTMLPDLFCGPTIFVSGCTFDVENEYDTWRVYAHQYRDVAGTQGEGRLAAHLFDPRRGRQLPRAHPGHRVRGAALIAACRIAVLALAFAVTSVHAATVERLRTFVRDTQTARALIHADGCRQEQSRYADGQRRVPAAASRKISLERGKSPTSNCWWATASASGFSTRTSTR